jgi:hypothetical protein
MRCCLKSDDTVVARDAPRVIREENLKRTLGSGIGDRRERSTKAKRKLDLLRWRKHKSP